MKKSWYLIFVFLFLFTVVVLSGGCGGSGGSNDVSGYNDDNSIVVPTPDNPSPNPDDTSTTPSVPVVPDDTAHSSNISVPVYTVIFDSDGGTEVENQNIPEAGNAVKPKNPDKEGYVFVYWLDEDENVFDFNSPIYRDILLRAEWAATIPATAAELALMTNIENTGIEGQTTSSMNGNDGLTNVEIQYTLDGIGTVEVSQVTEAPMLHVAGLIGSPIEIASIGGNVEQATITFTYDPAEVYTRASQLCAAYNADGFAININDIDLNDLVIAWYDEENDVIKLMEDSTVDTENHTVQTSTTHFSKYAVLLRNIWDWFTQANLPILRTDEIPYYNVVLVIDCSGSMSYEDRWTKTIQSAHGLIDALADGDYITVLSFSGYTIRHISKTKLQGYNTNKDNRKSIKIQFLIFLFFGREPILRGH